MNAIVLVPPEETNPGKRDGYFAASPQTVKRMGDAPLPPCSLSKT
jgi:hypothetical protein